jgi:hypothetical protein
MSYDYEEYVIHNIHTYGTLCNMKMKYTITMRV